MSPAPAELGRYAQPTTGASWRSLPEDLRRRIVECFPDKAVAELCRFGMASRGCLALVEDDMRRRCRGGGEALPPGRRSWTTLMASRRGLLRIDGDLLAAVSGADDADGGEGNGGGPATVVVNEFADLGLDADVLRGMRDRGLERPSPMQRRALPAIVAMRGALVAGPSGTGKVTAFAIGLVQNVDPRVGECQALVVTWGGVRPAAIQHEIREMGVHRRITVQIWGEKNPAGPVGHQVVVGALDQISLLVRRRELVLDCVRHLILDRADVLLAECFQSHIYEILRALPLTVSVSIFAQTLPEGVLRLASNVLPQSPALVLFCHKPRLNLDTVQQFHVSVEREEWKLDVLFGLLEIITNGPMVIYCNTQRKVHWLQGQMAQRNWATSCIHESMQHQEHERNMSDFCSGSSRALIAVDRAVDYLRIYPHVISFDFPTDRKQYMNRIGHSGEYGCKGIAISLVTERDMSLLCDIENYYSTNIAELSMDAVGFA